MPQEPAIFRWAELDPHQLDLPLRQDHYEAAPSWQGDQDFPSPQQSLAKFLKQFGAAEPMRCAGRLMRDFGSASGVLSASPASLRRSVGPQLADAIIASRDLMQAALIEKVAGGPVLSNRREVVMLLQAHLGSLRRERVIALYVDSKLRLLRIQRISDGTVTDAPLDLPRIIHCGLDVGAAGFLLVHNHPSGDASPSQSDRTAIGRLGRIAADLDMHLVDALIVAGREVRSMLGDWKAGAPSGACFPVDPTR